MGGIYGISKAAKLNEEGRYEQAIEAATQAIALDADDPEPHVERAFACAQLERYAAAVEDLERALRLDETAAVLETDAIDDAYFSALLGLARQEAAASVEAGVERLGRYREVLPAGRHGQDAADWVRRLRGDLPREIVKRRLED